jgi:hypothetical protein
LVATIQTVLISVVTLFTRIEFTVSAVFSIHDESTTAPVGPAGCRSAGRCSARVWVSGSARSSLRWFDEWTAGRQRAEEKDKGPRVVTVAG